MSAPATTAQACGRIAATLGCSVRGFVSRPWASVTFSGERARIETTADLPDFDDETDFTVPGFVVADIAKSGPRTIDVLLVADA